MVISTNNDVVYGNRMCRGLSCLSRESVATIGKIEDDLSKENTGSQTTLILERTIDCFRNNSGPGDPAALEPLLHLIVAAGPRKKESIAFLDSFAKKNKNDPAILRALIALSKKMGTSDGVAALLALRDSPNFKPGILANEAFCREFTQLVGNLSDKNAWGGQESSDHAWAILESAFLDRKFRPDYSGIKELASQFAEMRGRFSPRILKLMVKELSEAKGNMHAGEVFDNIKYALATIGEQMAVHLNNRFGIIYFSRYSKGTLEQAYNDLHSTEASNKPVLMIVFNKNDYNGAFYWAGKKLDDIREHFRIALYETKFESSGFPSQRSYYSLVKDTWEKYGRIGSTIIAGHGDPDSILLGDNDDEGHISKSDRLRLAKLGFCFAPQPTVILISCSTGRGPKAIGAMFRDIWGARVFAPKEDAAEAELSYKDGALYAKFGPAGWRYQMPLLFTNMANYYPPNQ
jgi:hypothetical protein